MKNEKQIRYRVRKEDINPAPPARPDGLTICLQCWKQWMGRDDRDAGTSRIRLDNGAEEPMLDENGRPIRIAYESDPYGEQWLADMKIGEATGAMIDDLKPAHRWAIYKSCGISSVWNFPSVDFLSCLASAQAELERKLRGHIATATQFA